jgi:hypothetical protein
LNTGDAVAVGQHINAEAARAAASERGGGRYADLLAEDITQLLNPFHKNQLNNRNPGHVPTFDEWLRDNTEDIC